MLRRLSRSTLFPYTTLFRSEFLDESYRAAGCRLKRLDNLVEVILPGELVEEAELPGRDLGGKFRMLKSEEDRKSTRLNSSHLGISYAVFCLKKKRRTA